MNIDIANKINSALDKVDRLQVWLRDDDAIQSTPQLEKLLELCEGSEMPLGLAVIPQFCKENLATRLSDLNSVSVLQHGYNHLSIANPGEKKCEFPEHANINEIKVKIQSGRDRLERFFADQVTPVFVPPWNRFAEKHIDSLKELGFAGISTFLNSQTPFHINTHFDPVFWKNGKRLHDTNKLISDLIDLISVHAKTGEALGLLTHHLDFKDDAWKFMHDLLRILSQHGNTDFVSVDQLTKPLPN